MRIGRGLLAWFLCLGVLLLAYLGAQIEPIVYVLTGVLLPLPVLLVGRRFGGRAALLLALATALFIFSLKPGLDIILTNLGFGSLLLMGVLLSSMQSRGLSSPQAIIVTVLVLNLLALLVLLGQAFFSGITLQALLAQRAAEIMESVQKVVGEPGGGSPGPLIPGVSQADLQALLTLLLPGIAITNMGLVAWINVILGRQLSLILGWGEPEPPLYYWSTPEWLIFVVLGAGFLLLLPLGGVRLISLNLLMVLAVLYFSQGVAVVAAWFHRWGLPRFLRVIGYSVLFLNPFFFLIITLGLMDLWLDFRRLHQPKDA